jgi:hypothetical protein
LAFALEGPSFQVNLENLPHRSHRLLYKAKSLLKEYFPTLVTHPAAIAVIRAQPEEPSSRDEATNDISSLNYIFTWFGPPPRLHPAVRLIFRNADRKILLDSTTEWRNLAFLASTLTGVFAILLKNGERLAKEIDLSNVSDLARRIGEIELNLEIIKKSAPKYGIQLVKGRLPAKEKTA